MSRSSAGRATARGVGERYLEFNANSSAVFTHYPQVEPLRLFVFKYLLLRRWADGWKDHVKRWLRPLLRRARTCLPDHRVPVLIWVENRREVVVDALLPVYRELLAREIDTDLVSLCGPHDLPAATRVFEFPARASAPEWAPGAWEALCACEEGLRDRALERSFYHRAAMLQALYEELHRLLEAAGPKVVVCGMTQGIGGAALSVAARVHGIASLVLQHGMVGAGYTPLVADLMLMWGASSEEIMLSLGVPQGRLLPVGSPRHDSMRPAGNGRARATFLRAVGLRERPTFVFFSNFHDMEGGGDAPVECVRWLERTAARFGDALNVVVRLHPNEDDALYRDCRHLTVMSRAVDLATALEGCDWIGSLCSTVLYDGLLYGKPVWQFYADQWPEMTDNWRKGLALRVSSERQLSELVCDMLSKGARGGVDEALVARVFANYGRATQAVADVVTSRLQPPGTTRQGPATAGQQ